MRALVRRGAGLPGSDEDRAAGARGNGTTKTDARKIALVTGADKGIGLEVCRQLARLGFAVLLGSRDASRGAAAAQKLHSAVVTAAPVRRS